MDLINKLSDYKNINLAYERVKNTQMNRELCAFHEQTLFDKCAPKIFTDINAVLKDPSVFEFEPIEVLLKPKKKTEDGWDVRPLSRISFYDAVVAQCVINIISEYIKPLLPAENFGYRLQSNSSPYFFERWQGGYSKFIEQEILALDENSPFKYAIEIDIEKFYPTINHEILLGNLSKHIVKTNMKYGNILLEWVIKILSIKCINHNGDYIDNTGLPQGPLYSPLLALFYIKDVFRDLKSKHVLNRVKYFAYVDDFRFYCEKKSQADRIFNLFNKYIVKELKLKSNIDKSEVLQLDDKKKIEAKIMGKASNLNRAINDEVILTVDGKFKMENNLLNLLYEAKLVFGEENDKFIERINKFVIYRIFKLINTSEQWNHKFDEIDIIELLNNNFVAMLHILFVTTNTVRDRQKLICMLQNIIADTANDNISYVKYLAYQYIYRWSPSELRLDNIKRREFVKLIEPIINKPIYLKAALSRCNEGWYKYIKEYVTEKGLRYDTREISATLYATLDYGEIPHEYSKKYVNPRLMQTNNKLKYIIYSPYWNDVGYLKDERFKNIKFKMFKHKSIKFRTFLRGEVSEETNSIYEIADSLDQGQRRIILQKVFQWMLIQLKSNEKVPYSVLDPHYIWIDGKQQNIILYGNPGYVNELFYSNPPSKIWKFAIENLYRCFFDLKVTPNNDRYIPYGITFWQFRLLELSKSRGLSLKRYLELALDILADSNENSSLPVDTSYIKLAKLARHYLNDGEIVDKFFEILRYVEASWKNGSKDCFFYTLHNQEHGRQLIYYIHYIIEESGFMIYLNKKEAFRLFSASLIHDIGMLSPPSKKILYDKTSKVYVKLAENLSKLPKINLKDVYDKIIFKAVLDIHKHVDNYYETIVRDLHPYITEQELNSDYPQLPLTVAERRDIGLISSAHGWSKTKFKKLLTDLLHDGRHPLNLKLLSLLLRIADLCDVTKERVSREVLERNYSRMDPVSLFHWAKHLSVDNILIERASQNSDKNITISIIIIHKYLPNINLEESLIKMKCGKICEFNDANIALADLAGSTTDKCRFHCIFINESYRYFFEEVKYLNDYFKEKKVNVLLNLKLILSPKSVHDFMIVKNRNEKIWAQDFMKNYFIS